MSDLLGISSGAVMAYQRALGTVSNNIANVGTDGYVRQETALAEAVFAAGILPYYLHLPDRARGRLSCEGSGAESGSGETAAEPILRTPLRLRSRHLCGRRRPRGRDGPLRTPADPPALAASPQPAYHQPYKAPATDMAAVRAFNARQKAAKKAGTLRERIRDK